MAIFDELEGLMRDDVPSIDDPLELELSRNGGSRRTTRRRVPRRRTRIVVAPSYFRFPRRFGRRRRRVVLVRPRRGFVLGAIVGSLFGLGTAAALSNLNSAQAEEAYASASEKEGGMQLCSDLPDSIKYLEEIEVTSEGEERSIPKCQKLADGSRICFFEWNEGEQDACIIPSKSR